MSNYQSNRKQGDNPYTPGKCRDELLAVFRLTRGYSTTTTLEIIESAWGNLLMLGFGFRVKCCCD